MKIILVAGLAIALSACSHLDDSQTDIPVNVSKPAQSYENCINEQTGEIIDPSYCYDGTSDTAFVYYPVIYNIGQVIEVDKSKKTKPTNIIVVPAARPMVPAPMPPKPPVYTPAPMPTVQLNKPAAPMPTVNQPAKVVPIPKVEANRQPAVKSRSGR